MSNKVWNYSAGPAGLPAEVMKRAQAEFCDFEGCGMGIMEVSHRGPQFQPVIDRAIANIREMMDIPENYEVIFVQGGASLQFSMIAMSLLKGSADYADTGAWSTKAVKEAKLFGKANVICSSKEQNYNCIPDVNSWNMDPNASYLHITTNNTIFGTQYHEFPEPPADVPLIADMSSDIMSRVVDVSKFGMIYGGLQKNLGPSGAAIVIVRKDLIADREPSDIPTMLKYSTHISKGSMFNTPPTFSLYMLALVTDWMKEQGGIAAIEKVNDAKSEALYEAIDSSAYYKGTAAGADRSKMNVCFRLPSEELESKFIKDAAANGLMFLKGHRDVGGCRASLYNAVPMAGVEALIDFMNEFKDNNPA